MAMAMVTVTMTVTAMAMAMVMEKYVEGGAGWTSNDGGMENYRMKGGLLRDGDGDGNGEPQ